MDDANPDRADVMARILADIRSLPEDQQHEAMMQFITCALEVMEVAQIRSMRAEFIEGGGGKSCPCDACGEEPASVLDLIDGHLALRELRGKRPLRS